VQRAIRTKKDRLERAANAQQRAASPTDPKTKTDYEQVGHAWRVEPSEPGRKADLLDWIVRVSDPIRPYSVAAFGIAAASVAVATLLRLIGSLASSDLRFAIYAPAIVATGLLAGVPAALAAAIASILITLWAFIPPYFQFEWLTEPEQLRVFFDAVPYLITVYFAYLCRVVLQSLRRGERN
jgi:hypothetical protein